MEREVVVPSLIFLCTQSISTQLIHGDDGDDVDNIFELPPDLFDSLLNHLPPLALHKLQLKLPSAPNSGASNNVRKRGRYGDFNTAWKTHFNERWTPGHVGKSRLVRHLSKQRGDDWHQMYWEAHIQNCLDDAAEKVFLPGFDGLIGEIQIEGDLMQSIGYRRCICGRTCEYSKLSYHCRQYARYAKCLRLPNVLCVSETCDLLNESRLQSVILPRIKSKEHVNGVSKLLNQNNETLSSLEFSDCQLPSSALDAICNSVVRKGIQKYGIGYFAINTSKIGESDTMSSPSGLLSFLSSGRSLCSLNLSDNDLGPHLAKEVFSTLLDSSSLSVLNLSENNIAGWLSNFNRRSSTCCPGIGKPLQSLRMLNLRGCNLHEDDADDLKCLLIQMPNLESLDISDNPIEDDGIRKLIPYFLEATERDFSLLDVKVEKCNLSCSGVTQLLRSLSGLKQLNALSIAYNDLGSQVAVPLATFLAESCVRVLNIEDIELGSSGFLELRKEMPKAVKLIDINISINRGLSETGNLVSELILRAPELVALNARYNFMPSESLLVVCSALKLSKGKLRQLDLTGNYACYQAAHEAMFAEFQSHGKSVVILPTLPTSVAPYDQDP